MPPGKEDEARGFYGGLLGMTEIPKPPPLLMRGGVWFGSASVLLHLGVDPEFRGATKAHPAFRCTDYAALVERLRKSGIEIARDEHLVNGREHCYIADPFGNRLELIAS